MVHVALLARLEAKPGKEDEVATLLTSALPLANAEPATTVWFALKLGPTTFGIFDAFPDDAGRQAHLAGQIAAALMASAGVARAAAHDRAGRYSRGEAQSLIGAALTTPETHGRRRLEQYPDRPPSRDRVRLRG